jgi:hypothetical protein
MKMAKITYRYKEYLEYCELPLCQSLSGPNHPNSPGTLRPSRGRCQHLTANTDQSVPSGDCDSWDLPTLSFSATCSTGRVIAVCRSFLILFAYAWNCTPGNHEGRYLTVTSHRQLIFPNNPCLKDRAYGKERCRQRTLRELIPPAPPLISSHTSG